MQYFLTLKDDFKEYKKNLKKQKKEKGRGGVGQQTRQQQNAKPGMRKIYHNNT